MRERPILFQGAMVRAILDGSKTQTRRVSGLDVINAAPERFTYLGVITGPGEPHYAFHDNATGSQTLVRCRSGLPGDRLWVREAWASVVDGPYLPEHYIYRADGNSDWAHGWKPSIHMPRVACRLVLEVTEVRVERLQDICEGDALDEGVSAVRTLEWDRHHFGEWRMEFDRAVAAGEKPPVGPLPSSAYRALWEQINGAGSWDLNPWVWVVSFRRLP